MSGNSVADLEELRAALVKANAGIQKARMSAGDRKRAYREFIKLAFQAIDVAIEQLRGHEQRAAAAGAGGELRAPMPERPVLRVVGGEKKGHERRHTPWRHCVGLQEQHGREWA